MNQRNVCGWRHWSWLKLAVQFLDSFRLVRNWLRGKDAVPTKPLEIRSKLHAVPTEPHAFRSKPHAVRTEPHAVRSKPHAVRTEPHISYWTSRISYWTSHFVLNLTHFILNLTLSVLHLTQYVLNLTQVVKLTGNRPKAVCTIGCNDSDGVVFDKPRWTVYLVLCKYFIRDNSEGKISGPCSCSKSRTLRRVWM